MSVSIRQITDKLGISKTSVYLYLKDPETRRVGEETKRRIDQAIAEINFRLNVNAQSLSTRKSRVVALLIPLNIPYFRNTMLNELLSGIQSVLFRKNYKFIFIPTDGERSPDIVRRQLETAYGYDGFILFGTRSCTIHDMQECVDHLLRAHTPFAVVNMPDLGYEINQVINVTPRSSSAVRFLLGLGHRRILLMAGSPMAPDSIDGIEEYRSCCAESGVEPEESLVRYGEYERPAARSEMLSALESGLEFSAVYCLNDTMALGVYDALKEKGRSIPGDISVVGRDDSLFAGIMSPSLTTIRIPMFEAGKISAELLLRSLETDSPPRRIHLQNELILRESTRVFKD